MIWYKFHLGDYITHTTHLSDAEDLTYRRLLDLYYMSEKPLPLDIESVSRKIRLDAELTESVLKEFFEERETGFHNIRCDAEIAKYQSQVATNRELGKRGGRPKNAQKQDVTQGQSESVTEPKPNINPKKIQNKNKNIKTSSSFDDFWAAWPTSKRKVAKVACLTKWVNHGLDEHAERIIANVNALKVSQQWQEGFEPAPLTYINQRRWEDEAPQAAVRRAI
jgi:uncharacterized protein YdaU (DUF1376 family)